MSRISHFLVIIFITLINIINAQQEQYNPDSILNQGKPLPEECKEDEKKKRYILIIYWLY